jgi:hypothetical protein
MIIFFLLQNSQIFKLIKVINLVFVDVGFGARRFSFLFGLVAFQIFLRHLDQLLKENMQRHLQCF